MSARDPTDWMWAQACEMLDRAERMQRRAFRLSTPSRQQAVWEPPVDLFEDDTGFVIVVALPGVPADRIEVITDGEELLVRAERVLPFAGHRRVVRRLEIPYGYFERRIRLPQSRLVAASRELVDGCLILRLRKIA